MELKHCPFCGANNAAVQQYQTGRSVRFSVACKDCWAMTNVYDAEDEAVNAWNRRVSND